MPAEPAPTGVRSAIAAGMPALIARILADRGFTDDESLRAFAHPTLRMLHDPSLMAGIDEASQRILSAAKTGRPIVIYGDYDVDGICATAILVRILRSLIPDAPVSTYVPHRLEEGYGLSTQAMQELAAGGAALVVSVDCGITAHAAAHAARDAGLELIITDHHNFDRDEHANPILPPAVTIVHPRLRAASGIAYPCEDLCGAGVAFKLAWRLASMHHDSERVDEATRTVLLDLLALAGLATIADIVPLIDENRVIARFGLERIRSTGLLGLRALLEASNLLGENITATEAGFILGPRLNACGRMGHAREAIELLTTADPRRAGDIARQLNTQNQQRRDTERRIFEQACGLAEDAGMTDRHRAIILADPEWHPGVVGIVCSRLVARYARPTILMQRADGICKGSGRSIDGFNLHAALHGCAHHLSTFGGHDMAAGLSLTPDALDRFTEEFLALAAQQITDDMLVPSLRIDAEARIEELDLTAARALANLGPFGRANPDPVIALRGVRLLGRPEPLGKDGKHLRLRVGDARHALIIKAWNYAEHADSLHAGATIDAALRLEVNTFRGSTNAEGTLADVRVH